MLIISRETIKGLSIEALFNESSLARRWTWGPLTPSLPVVDVELAKFALFEPRSIRLCCIMLCRPKGVCRPYFNYAQISILAVFIGNCHFRLVRMCLWEDLSLTHFFLSFYSLCGQAICRKGMELSRLIAKIPSEGEKEVKIFWSVAVVVEVFLEEL